MIDEKRIVAMTRMASYEANEGKEHIAVSRYFRSDFIGLQLLKGLICGTLAFCILVGLVAMYDLDIIMKDMYQMDLFQLAKQFILIYLIFMCIYLVICYVVAAVRYNRARQGLRRYYAGLKNLSKYYEQKGSMDV